METAMGNAYLGSTLWSATGLDPYRLFLRMAPDFSGGVDTLQIPLSSLLYDVQGTHLVFVSTNQTDRQANKQIKQENKQATSG